MRKFITILFFLFPSILCCAQSKSICITIDDLPVVSMDQSDDRINYITKSLLNTLKNFKVPAIGFVNEVKLTVDGKASTANEVLLTEWHNSGMELGNHTYSHIDANSNSIENIEKEIVNGEKFTNELFKSDKKRIKYLRHPFLHKGNTVEKKNAYAMLLQKYNYTEAPVTIDNSDYIFARAYDIAFSKKDEGMMKKIGEAYVPYMMSKVTYYENQANGLFQRNIAQILLLHANSINADYLALLFEAMKKDNYQFISLTAALKDPAYASTDGFVGNAGISWIHRWMITQKKPKSEFAGEPKVPEFILKYTGLEE